LNNANGDIHVFIVLYVVHVLYFDAIIILIVLMSSFLIQQIYEMLYSHVQQLNILGVFHNFTIVFTFYCFSIVHMSRISNCSERLYKRRLFFV
jgi:uncharacterized membrane protein